MTYVNEHAYLNNQFKCKIQLKTKQIFKTLDSILFIWIEIIRAHRTSSRKIFGMLH